MSEWYESPVEAIPVPMASDMRMRDVFAAAALGAVYNADDDSTMEDVARGAYGMADAMMKEREK